jgi:hypothetical protein
MDYARIYAEFIADRRSKENSLVGYTEKHHVVPRSQGGTDAASNLISLTPEDHIRAHVLLGRIYGGTMWFAVTAMMGNRKRYRRAPSRREVLAVAMARRAQMTHCVGDAHNRTGVPHTEETKARVSASMAEYLWWNNGQEMVRAKACPDGYVRGALPRGTPNWSEEGRARISAASKARDRSNQRGAANVSHRAEVKAKISAALRGEKHHSKKPGYVSPLKGDANPARRPEVRAVTSEKAAARQRVLKQYFSLSGYAGNKRTVTISQATEWLAANGHS